MERFALKSDNNLAIDNFAQIESIRGKEYPGYLPVLKSMKCSQTLHFKKEYNSHNLGRVIASWLCLHCGYK